MNGNDLMACIFKENQCAVRESFRIIGSTNDHNSHGFDASIGGTLRSKEIISQRIPERGGRITADIILRSGLHAVILDLTHMLNAFHIPDVFRRELREKDDLATS